MDSIPQKRCSGCKQELPATIEYFYAKQGNPNRLKACCRKCSQARYRKWSNHPYPTDVPKGYKRCTKCKKDLLATPENFRSHKLGKYGLHSTCKECLKQKRLEHREEINQYRKAKRQQDPAYRQQCRARSLNYLARKKAIQGTHSHKQIAEQLKRQNYRCYYAACGFAKFEKKKDGTYIYVVEHTYPIARVAGTDLPVNDISYLVLACPKCNAEKGSKYPWEWPEGGRLL